MQFKCLCGANYSPVPDEEAQGTPKSFVAKQFKCETCGALDWLEPYDLGADSWEDLLTDE